MPAEALQIFDPRRTMHVQDFSGRAATTTVHDATETGLSISGIFQAAEDFAVLCLYNAYDYFNHLRLKPLPRTDLSGPMLAFDIERTGTNEELVAVLAVDAAQNRLQVNVTLAHPAGSYVTLRVEGYHIAEKFAAIINDPGSPAGRYGPSQTAVITAQGGIGLNRSGYLRISFKPDANYGKLGHLDRVLATCGHQGAG